MKINSDILLLALLLAMAVMPWGNLRAQTDPAVKKQIESIRKAYTQAKSDMQQNDSKDFNDKNDMLVSSNYTTPEGNTRETIHYYYRMMRDERTLMVYYQPYFIVRQFNVGKRQFYEEYLFEGHGPTLTFVFRKYADPKGNPVEERYYYNFYGLIWKNLKGTNNGDEQEYSKKSLELLSAFNSIMNMNP